MKKKYLCPCCMGEGKATASEIDDFIVSNQLTPKEHSKG